MQRRTARWVRAAAALGTGITLLAASALALADDGHHQGGRSLGPQFGFNLSAFSDLGGASWASQAIGDVTGQCVMLGTGQGRFDPQGVTTRAEMAVMLGRLMGWSATTAVAPVSYGVSRAARRDRKGRGKGRGLGRSLLAGWASFRDAQAIPAWARSYVQAAVQNGVLQGEQSNLFAPAGAVTWAQAAVVLQRVFHFPLVAPIQVAGDLQQLPNGPATPTWAQRDVASLVAAGVLTGTLAQDYNPGQAITRADMAVLIQNAEAGTAQAVSPSSRFAVGRVLAVAASSLTLQAGCGAVTVPLAANVAFAAQGSGATASAVAPGDTVLVALSGGQGTFVDILNSGSSPTAQTVTGTVSAVSGTSEIVILEANRTSTFTLASGVAVTGTASSLSQVAPGDMVTLTLDPTGQVTTMDVTGVAQSSTVSGTLDAVNASAAQITVTEASGAAYTFQLASGVAVSGQVSAIGALIAGDQVTLTLANGQVTAIDVTAAPQTSSVSGTVNSVSTSAQQITVTESNGTAYTFTLATNVAVTGQVSSLSAIVAGDQVNLSIQNGQVTAIDVTAAPQTSSVSGTVNAVNASAQQITVTESNGTATTFALATNVAVTGQVGSLSAIAAGEQVTLSIQNGQVTAIDVTAIPQTSSVTGTVTAVSSSAVSIDESGQSTPVTFTLTTGMTVLVVGQAASSGAVQTGDQVTLTLNQGGQVTGIDVTAPPAVAQSSTVTLVATGTQPPSVVTAALDTSTHAFALSTVDLATAAAVTLGGAPSTLSSLKAGETVTLGLDAAGQAVSVAATPLPQGTVTATGVVDSNASGQVGIYTSSGQQVNVADGPTPLAVTATGGWTVVPLSSAAAGTSVQVVQNAVGGNSLLLVEQ